MERSSDWLAQAKRDLNHARNSLGCDEFEWACFAAQQAAEKAVKALVQALHAEAWGPSVSGLLRELSGIVTIDSTLVDIAKTLDRHYIPSRYPNSHPSGAPFEYYTRKDAEEAIEYAERIIRYCEDSIGTIKEKG